MAEDPTAPEPSAGDLPADGPSDVQDAAAVVEHDIATLVAERDEYRTHALRLQADFENYRKRADKQLTDEVDRQTGRLVGELLAVLDACEAAAVHHPETTEPIWSSLYGSLRKQGLEAMDALGHPFDPASHEAVVHEPGDGGHAVVTEVLRTGYRWKGRVLRAAMVKVKD